MGLFHRLGPWAVLLLIQSPSAAALANAPMVVGVGGVSGGQAALMAQGGGRGEQEIPAEVRGWVEGAKAAYTKGDPAEALRLQLQAMDWVNARLGPLDPFRAPVLNNLSLFLRFMGRPREALAPAEEAVRITRVRANTNPGAQDELLNLGKALTNLGASYSELDRPQEARAPMEEVVKIYRQLVKEKPVYREQLAEVLMELGTLYGRLDWRREARGSMEDVVRIYRELVKETPTYRVQLAAAMMQLSGQYRKAWRFNEMAALSREATNINHELVKENPVYRKQLAYALAYFAENYTNSRFSSEAIVYWQEAAKSYRQLAKESPLYREQLAKALSELGDQYFRVGSRYEEAAVAKRESDNIYRELVASNPAFTEYPTDVFDEAVNPAKLLRLKEEVRIKRELAKSNPAARVELAAALRSLASRLGPADNQLQLASFNEAVKIYRGLAKEGLIDAANLAGAFYSIGILSRNDQVHAIAREGVKLYRDLALVNPVYREVLASVLLGFSETIKSLAPAEELAIKKEAVSIYRELSPTIPATRPKLARALLKLSDAIELSSGYKRNRCQKTLILKNESLQIQRQLVKDDPALQAILAQNLLEIAACYSQIGDHKEQLKALREAERNERELVGILPPEYGYGTLLGDTLYQQSNVYSRLGRRKEALVLMEATLRAYRKHVPGYNCRPDIQRTFLKYLLINLRLETEPGKIVRLFRELVGSQTLYCQRIVQKMPVAERGEFLDESFYVFHQPFDWTQRGKEWVSLALFSRLNRQGLLQDIQRNQLLLARNGPHRPLFEQLKVIDNQLSSPNKSPELISQLQDQSMRLQRELYRLLPEIQPRVVEPMQVAQRLPDDAVLVEFQRYRSFATAKPRYLALVLTPRGTMHAVPLGDASELEPILQNALRLVADPNQAAEWGLQALTEVRRRLFDPLLPHIGAAKRWIVSPDGEIHRVPLAALPASDGDLNGATLGETRQLRVITTGRDLLEEALAPASPSAALVMADPDYDARLGPSSPGATPRGTLPQTRSGDDLAKRWGPLPEFKEEGEEVAALLGSSLISGVQATTTRLQRAQGPRIVHIATHGFFLPDRKEDLDAKGPFQGFTTLEMTLLAREDPQLRSGIVLAGANHPEANPNDDGRLTALEATALNLSGTALVTLSACSTGLGSQATGEGVYGLQRALRVAGARSTLLSLWKVDDRATKVFMERFYTLLQQGVGRAEALREVQRQFRDAPIKNGLLLGWSHPYYWAAWQLSGDSGALPPIGPKPNQAQP